MQSTKISNVAECVLLMNVDWLLVVDEMIRIVLDDDDVLLVDCCWYIRYSSCRYELWMWQHVEHL